MGRLSDALRQARDPQADRGSGAAPSAREMVVASDESVVVPPWTFDHPGEAPVDEPAAPADVRDAVRLMELGEEPKGVGRRLAAAGVLVASVVGVAWFLGQRNTTGNVAEFQVQRGSLRQIVAARGRVEPGTEIGVTAKMIGRIKAVHVREGDLVTRGQLLSEMEDEDLRAQLAQASADLAEARARLADVLAGARPQEREAARARVDEVVIIGEDARAALDRQRVLAANGLVPRAQVDEAERRDRVVAAQLRTAQEQANLIEAGARDEVRAVARAQVARAEANVQHAEALLTNARVLAPVSGRVLGVYMHPGEVLVMQRPQPIILLGEGHTVYVRAEVDESDLSKVRLGQPASVRSDAYPEKVFVGRVVEIATVVGRKMLRSDDPAEMLDTKVIETRIELAADTTPALGLTANVEILVVDEPDVTIVPASAVRWEDGITRVEVRSGNRSEMRTIVTGARDEEFVEVRDGLREREIVVLRPQMNAAGEASDRLQP